nr:immunoglobulin heavy chain junction region [Macaca mulatta]MOX00435.1 immunoglobulin heavy chain junction region [Macaca mulatta]MOX02168.1 immunoglobulin heavy chain junction region [Macaca mulatta]MOX04495.1 immunoglobulin heavy chain junction region [Macaca mulatta]MOX05538.1 immunoglobulin heavy chain junction region [Macaca mulatta]
CARGTGVIIRYFDYW